MKYAKRTYTFCPNITHILTNWLSLSEMTSECSKGKYVCMTSQMLRSLFVVLGLHSAGSCFALEEKLIFGQTIWYEIVHAMKRLYFSNSSMLSDAYIRPKTRTSLAWIMACRLLGARPLLTHNVIIMLTYCPLEHEVQRNLINNTRISLHEKA